MADKNSSNVTITTGTIFKVILILLALWFIYQIRSIIGIIFVSIIFTAGIIPWVDWLENKRIPRVLGTSIIYAVVLGMFSLIVVLIIPPLSDQVGQIVSAFPDYYEKIVRGFETLETSNDSAIVSSIQGGLESVNEALRNAASGILSSLVTIFGGLASFVSVIVITFYLVLERNGFKKIIHSISPVQYQPYMIQLSNRITTKLGSWLRGQLMLSLIIFVMSYIGLLLLNVKYALVLALIAGLFEFIPIIGPIIGAIPALFLSFAESPGKALMVLILYIVIQQLENQIIVPKVMQKSVGLNPVIVIIAMLIGAQLGGVLGMILAIPVAAIIQVFSSDFFGQRRAKDNQLEESESP